MLVIVTEKESSEMLSKWEAGSFMSVLDDQGIRNVIGNNRFLDDYVKEFNNKFPKLEAKIHLEDK